MYHGEKKYVVAHNRDRDFYQVALALDEVNALSSLVTDYYYGSAKPPISWFLNNFLTHRQAMGLSRDLTLNTWRSVLSQSMAKLLPSQKDWMSLSDKQIGRHALSCAIKNPNAGLLLYASNAYEAFSSPIGKDREKVLFHFHPHTDYISQVLSEDLAIFGIGGKSLETETRVAPKVNRLNAEISLSDRIICASSLSKKSLEFSGLSNGRIDIAPYGTVSGRMKYTSGARSLDKVRFLFVGQGIQRKGLHHLLLVWEKMRLTSAELVLICSSDPDGIIQNLPDNVVVKSSLSLPELQNEFLRAHAFVLPSLIEGFGLVLLEAMQAGCFTLFSDATGFTDLDIPKEYGLESDAGDLAALETNILETFRLARSNQIDHYAISQHAETITMTNFRKKIREILL